MALIPLKKGARQLLTEMGNTPQNGPEIIIGGFAPETGTPRDPKLSKVMTFSFGRDPVPVLNSHEINGEPVVPLALMMECLAKASEKTIPAWYLPGWTGCVS
nr:hypothetical protein [Desulfobacula sp.]